MPKYQLVEMSDLRNSGKRRVYPKLIANRTMSLSDLLDKMKLYNRGLSPTVVEAAVTDVRDVLVEMLAMGYNVNIDGLGSFSLSLDFEDDKPTEMQSDDDKMVYRKVGVKNVNFKPSSELVKDVKNKTDRYLERNTGGVKVIRKELYTQEQRVARAVKVIEERGFIGLTDYAYLNNLSRTAASLELKEICAKEDSPIQSVGQHSHKVWVKRKD